MTTTKSASRRMEQSHRTRRRVAATVAGVTVLLVGVLSGPAPAAFAAPPADAMAAARSGAGWLAARLDETGAARGTGGTPSFADTREIAFALAGVEGYGAEADRALAWMASEVNGAETGARDLRDSRAVDLPGRLAQVILAVVARGGDPTAFGGRDPINDLVGRLLATRRTTGADAGLFGTQAPLFDGAFRQGLALAALASVGRGDDQAAAWLAAQQCNDGTWTGYRGDLSAPCAFDPDTFTGPETNSTALATIGLIASCQSPRIDVVPVLRNRQNEDGGWSYSGLPGDASDPNSSAVVTWSLLSLGIDPAAEGPGGSSAYDALGSFQFTDGADAGAFWYPPFGEDERTASLLATSQAVLALSGRTLPWRRSDGMTGCAVSPGPTSTTTSTSSSTSTSTTASQSTTTTSTPSTFATSPSTIPPAASPQPVAVEGTRQTRPAVGATAIRSAPRFAG